MAGKKKTETPIVTPEIVTAELLRNRLEIVAPDLPIYIIDPLTGFETPLRLSALGRNIARNAEAALPVRIVIKNLPGDRD